MQIRKETECSCDICKSMCKKCPCMGTPADIQKIIDAGLKEKLILNFWPDPKNESMPLPSVAPILTKKGCIFHDQRGLCELHDRGLKPTEGKLAIHNLLDDGLRRAVAYTWISEEGIVVFEQFTKDLSSIIRKMIPFVKQTKFISF